MFHKQPVASKCHRDLTKFRGSTLPGTLGLQRKPTDGVLNSPKVKSPPQQSLGIPANLRLAQEEARDTSEGPFTIDPSCGLVPGSAVCAGRSK